MPIKIEIEVKDEDINSLLVSAFEGGSNYWYYIVSQNDANMHPADLALTDLGEVVIRAIEEDTGEYEFEHEGKKEWILNQAAIKRGLQVMAEKWPLHFASIMDESQDAETADVFLQCCLFGDIIFG